MKRIFYTLLFVGSFITGVYAQTFTELLVPQYLAARTAATVNNARMPFIFCFQVTGLTPNQAYDMRVGLGLTTDAATSYGAGNQWNGTSLGTANYLSAFTTDGSGNSGPVWAIIQPTGNSTGGRFLPGSLHNVRIGIVASGGSMPSSPSFIGTKNVTGLDLGNTALTVSTSDDGAFILGNANSVASGSYVLAYNNTAGTGDPIAIGWVRTHSLNQATNSELPTAVNNILMGTSVVAGDYALLIPIGANNTNGIRRLETRSAANVILSSATDADGSWPSGANTTTALRRDVITITSTDAALPVQWRSFTASQTPSGNQLRWSTANEVNNNQFEVQRSNNGRTFETIGVVKGKGNSQKVTNYAFTDEVVSKGTVFYRLKQIDFDGKFEYSKTVSITVATPTSGISQLSPNPFSNEINVTIKAASSGTASVVVMDMVGKVHHSFTSEVNSGAQTIRFETADMPDGIYFVRATINGETFTQKIIKK